MAVENREGGGLALRYIILNSDKTPAEKLTDGGHPRSEVEDFENLAVLFRAVCSFRLRHYIDAEIIMEIVRDPAEMSQGKQRGVCICGLSHRSP